jgi:hypothetical protein
MIICKKPWGVLHEASSDALHRCGRGGAHGHHDRELVETKKMTDQQFHDTIRQNGRIPVEMVRALLTNQPLARSHKASWRF